MTISTVPARRIYHLESHDLTEEQTAVVFAMTSRSPAPFDQIAETVSQERASDFHEKWVVGYGHSSVAEHAIVHMAVENISRLACDALEDNRLASYTEKSSRYQVIDKGYYHIPAELDNEPNLKDQYVRVCDTLFDCYARLVDGCMAYLKSVHSPNEKESDSAYTLRLRRMATDNCRGILPAATLTNVGITANARTLEHAISKLLSGKLEEEIQIGNEVRDKAREVTPTLVKYADRSEYLASHYDIYAGMAEQAQTRLVDAARVGGWSKPMASLVDYDIDAVKKLAAVLVYAGSDIYHYEARRKIDNMSMLEAQQYIDQCLESIGEHDVPPRALEVVNYTFEFLMDYGALREYKRHRMQTYIPQQLTVAHGYQVPPLVAEAKLDDMFNGAIGDAENLFWKLRDLSPPVAKYVVTHAHNQRLLAHMNLRECFHLFKLRTSNMAHASIRGPMLDALQQVVGLHPNFFKHLKLRDYPEWWPSSFGK